MYRVLHIVHAITKGGGLCNMIINYYRFMDRSKIQFDFLYFKSSEDTFQEEIESLGGRCFHMSEPSINIAFFKEREAFFKSHEGEWNAIHCHALFASAIFTSVAKRYRVSHSHSHSHNVGYGKGNFLKRIRNKYFIYKTKVLGDTHLACSKDAAAFMYGEKELRNGKAIIINNAIDLEKYWFNNDERQKMRLKLGIDNKLVIGHVGGFVPQKNQAFLIDMFYELQKRKPDSVLLLIGGEGIASGSTKQALVERVKKYGITDKVKFMGLRDDVNILYQAMDAFVFPSVFEGLGIVLVEAQASGLPCVVSPAIPSEAKVLPTYTVMDSLEHPDEWANYVEKSIQRNIAIRDVDHTLFDAFNIRKQIKKLEDIYLNMTNE